MDKVQAEPTKEHLPSAEPSRVIRTETAVSSHTNTILRHVEYLAQERNLEASA